MAQLLLTGASAVGGAVAKAGLGAIVARTIAGTAASFAAGIAERAIFGPKKRSVEGPRLESFQVQASTEGAAILRVFGRARVAGQIVWAANFKERVSETTESSGKGGRLAATKTTTTEYLYSISFAVGLCEGVIDRIARVWADGKPFDISPHNVRVYRGEEAQLPDALIEAVEGAGAAPAFRGLAYLVFEDLPLGEFGNRIPQFSFEIEKSLRAEDPAALENALTAVTLIPGSGEFALGTTPVLRETGPGAVAPENVHNSGGASDIEASLDALTAACPNLGAVSLVVSWFGTDLNAGACEIRPGVEVAAKSTTPYEWRAGGVGRDGAHLVSTIDGAPAYGGAPSDRSVREAIAALNARGLDVMLHPFVLMDIPSGNGKTDPYGGGEQAAYPWRGRITVGDDDGSAAAASDVAAFFGAAAPGDFSLEDGEIVYAGPDEWSYRRMVLHMAHLAAEAGGVARFLIGSELRGLTTARASGDAFPAVAALKALAGDVRSILGPAVKISYGADWSEYFGFQPADGSGDVFFHLDPLWADDDIDFIGVDNYMPLADWRGGFAHADAAAGWASPYDRAYLQSNIEGGEGYDWYYASDEARAAQTRTPIADGAYGEPWVYRYKDLRAWWSSPHHERPGGVRNAAATAWVPQSKPIVFTETGCPAVDKGANQPNVFVDPKSAESALPYFSSGARDDLMQRRAVEALLGYWAAPANNPVSSVYGAPMIEAGASFIYTYDARPFPFFPALAEIWGDAANWEKGHWLNGRLGRAPLDLLVKALAAQSGVTAVDTARLSGQLTGYVVDRPLSARETIDPLADIYQFDMVETGEALRFQQRGAPPAFTLAAADLAARDEGAVSVSAAQAGDLPASFNLGFLDGEADYLPAVALARDPRATHRREAGLEAPLVIDGAEAAARARAILADAAVMRETATFSLPPALLSAEPGDIIYLEADDVARRWRITEIVDAAERRVEAARVSPAVYDSPLGAASFAPPPPAPVYGAPLWALMDLPALDGFEPEDAGAAAFAAFAEPWPGAAMLYRDGAGGPVLAATATRRGVIGALAGGLPAFTGAGRWNGAGLGVRLAFGAFASRSAEEVLAGANALAVETPAGWEVLQFETASLGEDGVWTLAPLLRGQAGTEDCAAAGAAEGAVCVLLNAALAGADYPLDRRGDAQAFEAGPDGAMPGGAAFSARDVTLNARGLAPLAPVHLRADTAGTDLRLTWIRRTRLGGDGWTGEVRLGEAYERYRMRIMDGDSVLRTAETATADFLYTAAMIEADFGSGGIAEATAPRFEVAQVSDRVGEGRAARGDL